MLVLVMIVRPAAHEPTPPVCGMVVGSVHHVTRCASYAQKSELFKEQTWPPRPTSYFSYPPRSDKFSNFQQPRSIVAMSPTPQSIIEDQRSRQRQAAQTCEPDDIWNASQTLEDPPWGAAKGFTYPPGSKERKIFVKYTKVRSKWLLEPEKRNQEFAFNTLRRLQQPASPQGKLLVCVPEIFRAFEHRDYYYLVMECVPGKHWRNYSGREGPGRSRRTMRSVTNTSPTASGCFLSRHRQVLNPVQLAVGSFATQSFVTSKPWCPIEMLRCWKRT